MWQISAKFFPCLGEWKQHLLNTKFHEDLFSNFLRGSILTDILLCSFYSLCTTHKEVWWLLDNMRQVLIVRIMILKTVDGIAVRWKFCWWKLISSLCTCRASPAHDPLDLASGLSAELVSQHSQRSLSYTGARPVSPETEPRSRSFDHQRDESGVDKGNLALDQLSSLYVSRCSSSCS
jgi:hypothetical protein